MKYIINTLINTFITSGISFTILLTILNLIINYTNLISFYAFFSGSFILVNLYQYYTIVNKENKSTDTFLIHSIIGGIFWVILSVLMYILHINNITYKNIISLTFFISLIISIVYLILCINNIFNF
mgnify:CR=1 FL=1